MASAALGDELSCSVCLKLCTEPVTPECGHNFCRDCMGTVLDTRDGSGVSCPVCREDGSGVTCPVCREDGSGVSCPEGREDGSGVSCPEGREDRSEVTCLECRENGSGVSCPVGREDGSGVSCPEGREDRSEVTCLECRENGSGVSCPVGREDGSGVSCTEGREDRSEVTCLECRENGSGVSCPVGREDGSGVSCPEGREDRSEVTCLECRENGSGVSCPVGREDGSGVSCPVGREDRSEVTCLECRENGSGVSSPVCREDGSGVSCTVCREDGSGVSCPVYREDSSGVSCPVWRENESGVSCPVGRVAHGEHPTLEKNRKLCDTAKSFQCANQENTETMCTYCDLPQPAVKTCLQCESSFCERHLLKHGKLTEHVLVEPASNQEDRKCSVHKEILKYYCWEDMVSTCVSCCLVGRHRGHRVELLSEVSEKKKDELRKLTERLNADLRETDKSVHQLSAYRKDEKGKAEAVAQKVNELFGDIRRQLDVLEWKVLCEVFKQEKKVAQSVSRLIQQLKMRKVEISKKIDQIEELCRISDPFIFLEKKVDSEELKPRRCEILSDVRDAGGLDEIPISKMLHQGLLLFANGLTDLNAKRRFSVMKKADILLDVNTAHNNIIISKDLRSASYTDESQKRPNRRERFACRQVMSANSFSSGKHYWEVDVSGAKKWLIGVAAHSIDRKQTGKDTYIGYNAKSWGLYENNFFRACHNNVHKVKEKKSPLEAIGIYVDYEAGLLSFYELSEPIRLLHTFTATFTEPLYAAFYVFPGSCVKIIN